MKKLLLIMIVSLMPTVVFANMIKIEANEFANENRDNAWYHSKYNIIGASDNKDGNCEYFFSYKNDDARQVILKKNCEEFLSPYDTYFIKIEAKDIVNKEGNPVYHSLYNIVGAADNKEGYCVYSFHFMNKLQSAILKTSCEEFFKGHDFMIKIEKNDFLKERRETGWYHSKYNIILAVDTKDGHCAYSYSLEKVNYEVRLKKSCEEFLKEQNFMIKIEPNEFLEAVKRNIYYSKYNIIGAQNIEGGHCKSYIPFNNQIDEKVLKKNCEEFFKEHNFMIKIEGHEFFEEGNAWYQSIYSIIGAQNIEGGHCKVDISYGNDFRTKLLKKSCEEFFKKHNIQVK